LIQLLDGDDAMRSRIEQFSLEGLQEFAAHTVQVIRGRPAGGI